jgi:tripartite-type tricarboxylate transporter receptor subunit TctC
MLNLRLSLSLVLLSLCMFTLSPARADWPERPVHILIGYAPGGTIDNWARMMGRRYEERFKEPFVVENRPGANATLVTTAIANGPADGYQFAYIALHIQGKNFQKNVTYDVMKDFEPLAGLESAPYILVSSSHAPYKTLAEFVDYAKVNPGKVNYGVASTTFQLIGAMMQKSWGVDMLFVPYKGQAPALTALISGEIDVLLQPAAGVQPMAQAGKLRVLAQSSKTRSTYLPDVPTLVELGYPDLTFAGVDIFWGKKGFLKEAADKINSATPEILKSPEIVERMRADGGTPLVGTQAELWDIFLKQYALMAEAARISKYEPQ